MDPEDLARRLRAARAYAGLRSVEALADAIDEKGLGVKTLRSIEQGTRPAYRRELAAIAEACGLPVQFFTAAEPFNAAGDLEGRLDRIEAALIEASANTTAGRAEIMGLLQTQQHILERMEAAAGVLTDENVQALNDAARRLEGLG